MPQPGLSSDIINANAIMAVPVVELGIFRRKTVNVVMYQETLRKLRQGIQNKWGGMLSHRIVFLHNNARPHSAKATQYLLSTFYDGFCDKNWLCVVMVL